MSSTDTGSVAVRFIDDTFTVVDQNGAMTDLTDGRTEPTTCRDQLSGPYCETDRCSLIRLREGDESVIEEQIEMELPNGEKRRFQLIAEAYTTGETGFEGIVESLMPLPDSPSERSTETGVLLPDPTDPESFRMALRGLLEQAAANDVPIENRSWDCPAPAPKDRWEVTIVPVRSKRPRE